MVSLTKQKHTFAPVFDALTRTQLGPFARLGNAIDAHLAGFDLGVSKTARMTQPGGFEHLVQLNVIATNGE